ncbi:MAG: hypothetical protein JXA25_20230 [Anaerolineales bacterium]|nr:hypothetical protein [Anaerolineales bacterium]
MSKHKSKLFLSYVFIITLLLSAFTPITDQPPPKPDIAITSIAPRLFPNPYGYGLSITYSYKLYSHRAPNREAVSFTTQYSLDGENWQTDEAARSLEYLWDNIHGDVVCGPTTMNLESGRIYYVRVILNYRVVEDVKQVVSNVVQATVPDYGDLCLEQELAEKFAPVLHRHPDDYQPPYLINVDNLTWASRRAYTSLGDEIPSGSNQSGITKHSDYHWQYNWHWDTWGRGQTTVTFKWDMDNSNRYKVEEEGESPLYYHVYKEGGYYYIQYWYFFAMNNISPQMSNSDPWHEGDFEHVSIEVEKVGNKYVPRRVNFYFHEGGEQFPAEQCFWGSANFDAIPQYGYDESRTHLHVWIARNSHASYNYEQAIYQLQTADGDSFTDEVYYRFNINNGSLEDSFYHYDYLINMGEVELSPDTDNDGRYNAHGLEWFEHYEHEPAWNDLQWMPFVQRLGDYWCKNLIVTSTCTPSPHSPAFGIEWMDFSDNENTCGGFGNHGTYFFGLTIAATNYLDPRTGSIRCSH